LKLFFRERDFCKTHERFVLHELAFFESEIRDTLPLILSLISNLILQSFNVYFISSSFIFLQIAPVQWKLLIHRAMEMKKYAWKKKTIQLLEFYDRKYNFVYVASNMDQWDPIMTKNRILVGKIKSVYLVQQSLIHFSTAHVQYLETLNYSGSK